MSHPDLNELRRVARGGNPSRPPASTGSNRPPASTGGGVSFGIIILILFAVGSIYGISKLIHSNNSVTTRVSDSIQSSSSPRITSIRPPAKTKIKAITLGVWHGVYGSELLPTTLYIWKRAGNCFNGTLTVHGHKGNYKVAIEGTLPGDDDFDFQETQVISHPRSSNWLLGKNRGGYENKARVSGKGNDTVHSYTWTFRR